MSLIIIKRYSFLSLKCNLYKRIKRNFLLKKNTSTTSRQIKNSFTVNFLFKRTSSIFFYSSGILFLWPRNFFCTKTPLTSDVHLYFFEITEVGFKKKRGNLQRFFASFLRIFTFKNRWKTNSPRGDLKILLYNTSMITHTLIHH